MMRATIIINGGGGGGEEEALGGVSFMCILNDRSMIQRSM